MKLLKCWRMTSVNPWTSRSGTRVSGCWLTAPLHGELPQQPNTSARNKAPPRVQEFRSHTLPDWLMHIWPRIWPPEGGRLYCTRTALMPYQQDRQRSRAPVWAWNQANLRISGEIYNHQVKKLNLKKIQLSCFIPGWDFRARVNEPMLSSSYF